MELASCCAILGSRPSLIASWKIRPFLNSLAVNNSPVPDSPRVPAISISPNLSSRAIVAFLCSGLWFCIVSVLTADLIPAAAFAKPARSSRPPITNSLIIPVNVSLFSFSFSISPIISETLSA